MVRPQPRCGRPGWACEGACLLAYAGWIGDGLDGVGDVEDRFAKVCFEAEARIGEPAACRWLLDWFDNTPLDEVRRDLLPEIDAELERREEVQSFA